MKPTSKASAFHWDAALEFCIRSSDLPNVGNCRSPLVSHGSQCCASTSVSQLPTNDDLIAHQPQFLKVPWFVGSKVFFQPQFQSWSLETVKKLSANNRLILVPFRFSFQFFKSALGMASGFPTSHSPNPWRWTLHAFAKPWDVRLCAISACQAFSF